MKYSKMIIIVAVGYMITACSSGGGSSNPVTENKKIDSDLVAYYSFSGNVNDESVNKRIDGVRLD